MIEHSENVEVGNFVTGHLWIKLTSYETSLFGKSSIFGDSNPWKWTFVELPSTIPFESEIRFPDVSNLQNSNWLYSAELRFPGDRFWWSMKGPRSNCSDSHRATVTERIKNAARAKHATNCLFVMRCGQYRSNSTFRSTQQGFAYLPTCWLFVEK